MKIEDVSPEEFQGRLERKVAQLAAKKTQEMYDALGELARQQCPDGKVTQALTNEFIINHLATLIVAVEVAQNPKKQEELAAEVIRDVEQE